MTVKTGDAHLGGCFSEIEILIALYDKVMNKEDKFILSKGHGCLVLFTILEHKGFHPKYSGHPDIDEKNLLLI